MSDLVVPGGSAVLTIGFVALSLALAIGFAIGLGAAGRRTGAAAPRRSTQRALAVGAAWLALTAALAARGLLRFDGRPPTMLVALAAAIGLTVMLARSPVGRRLATGLPLSVLVGYQGFRVVVELLLHRAYVEGLMPVQMSYAGRNFDVVTGIGAVALGTWLAAGNRSRRLVAAWNSLGLLLLANVVGVALLSAPTPFRTFHNAPANVWITRAPWVWLPLAMVPMALLGHLLVLRRLRWERVAARRASGFAAEGTGVAAAV